jgi:zinc protease
VDQLLVPTDDPAHLGKGLDILHDWAAVVSFEGAEVDKERGVVLEEWRLGRGAQQRVLDKAVKVMFKGSRYASSLPAAAMSRTAEARRRRRPATTRRSHCGARSSAARCRTASPTT